MPNRYCAITRVRKFLSQESPKVTVKLRRSGWEVEITCTQDRLKEAIDSVLSSLNTSGGLDSIKNPRESLPAPNKTCRGLVLDLWHDSWLSEAHSLSEVHEEIARRGYNYDRTAVSHSLTDLVREGVLTRMGNMRNYTYIQKRPPPSGHDDEAVTKEPLNEPIEP
jgi:hypothetical protein